MACVVYAPKLCGMNLTMMYCNKRLCLSLCPFSSQTILLTSTFCVCGERGLDRDSSV